MESAPFVFRRLFIHSILVDLNNFGFAGLAATRLSAGGKDTQAIWSVIKSIRATLTYNQNANIICLDDGRSWRKDVYPEYKANRVKTEKDVALRESYFEQKKGIKRALELLGIRQMMGTNWEADDLAALVSNKLAGVGTVSLFTADQDWQQLVTPDVDWFDIIHQKRCTYQTFKNTTDFKDAEQFIEAKCILGDKGDNIIGVNGIGPKALEGIYASYENIEQFLEHMDTDREHQIVLWKVENGKIMPKVLREIDTDLVRAKLKENMILVDLGTTSRPPIDKMIDNKGILDEDGFKAFCYEHSFLSIIKDFDNFMEPFRKNNYVNKR